MAPQRCAHSKGDGGGAASVGGSVEAIAPADWKDEKPCQVEVQGLSISGSSSFLLGLFEAEEGLTQRFIASLRNAGKNAVIESSKSVSSPRIQRKATVKMIIEEEGDGPDFG